MHTFINNNYRVISKIIKYFITLESAYIIIEYTYLLTMIIICKIKYISIKKIIIKTYNSN